MDCCQCQGIEREFDRKSVLEELEDYQAGEVDKTTQWLIDAIVELDISGNSLLDIGGGVGMIQHQLLQAGVSEVVSVDASTAYYEASMEEAERRGFADKITFQHGNFVSLAEDLAPADIVTLDRVVCCYHDMPALLGRAATRANRVLGLVYPRDAWWLKLGSRFANGGLRLQRNPFRVFIHPVSDIESIIHGAGFKERFARSTMFWNVRLYEKL